MMGQVLLWPPRLVRSGLSRSALVGNVSGRGCLPLKPWQFTGGPLCLQRSNAGVARPARDMLVDELELGPVVFVRDVRALDLSSPYWMQDTADTAADTVGTAVCTIRGTCGRYGARANSSSLI